MTATPNVAPSTRLASLTAEPMPAFSFEKLKVLRDQEDEPGE
jgi:hypothetical protein